jgi:hypothetical protein
MVALYVLKQVLTAVAGREQALVTRFMLECHEPWLQRPFKTADEPMRIYPCSLTYEYTYHQSDVFRLLLP